MLYAERLVVVNLISIKDALLSLGTIVL